MIIIGFCGQAATGKTTAQRYLMSKLNNIEPITIAHPIKILARKIYNLSVKQVFGTLEEKETVDPRWGKSPRELMQDLGEQVRNETFDDVWIQAAYNRILLHQETHQNFYYVIDDVRYYNEIRFLKNLGALLVKLEVPGDAKSKYGGHISEQEITKVPKWYFDHIIKVDRSRNAELLKNEIHDRIGYLYK